jgi:L-iditol 2-dehydrogenase
MLSATVTGKNALSLDDVAVPAPGAGEVLLRVLACGICGSDLHILRNGWTQAAPGHEIAGVVESVGPGVEAIRPGMRLCAECFQRCGECASCLDGATSVCESFQYVGGAFAEYAVVQVEMLHSVGDEMTDVETAMVEPLAVAVHAMRRAEMDAGATVGIVGGGTIGLLCAATARAWGAQAVALVAKHPHQKTAAFDMGAMTGDGKPSDVLRLVGSPLDIAVDAVTQGTSFSTALAAVRPRGTVVVVGEPARPALAALAPLVHNEIRVMGSFCYAPEDFTEAIRLIEERKVDVARLVTHEFPLSEVTEAFATASDKTTGAIKVLVRPGAEAPPAQ